MLYRLAADGLVVFHLLFILFVLTGGFLALRWRWIVLAHLPAVAWGMAVEFLHLYCPLTVWENLLRERAGDAGYGEGFIQHYLIGLIYPSGLTPQIQVWLGSVVVVLNLLAYGWLLRRAQRA